MLWIADLRFSCKGRNDAPIPATQLSPFLAAHLFRWATAIRLRVVALKDLRFLLGTSEIVLSACCAAAIHLRRAASTFAATGGWSLDDEDGLAAASQYEAQRACG